MLTIVEVMAQTPLIRTERGNEKPGPTLFCLSTDALEVAWGKLVSADERNRLHAYVRGHLFLYHKTSAIGLNLSAEESDDLPIFTDAEISRLCDEGSPFGWAPGSRGSPALRTYTPDFTDVR